MNTIYFDMDGTIVDLYGVDGWLDKIRAFDATPYRDAKPLIKLNILAKMLHQLQKRGYKIGVISWLARTSTADYDKQVTSAKADWLRKHLPSVEWDEVHIIHYGIRKSAFSQGQDILFDDEDKNRSEWNGTAFDATNIINDLKRLMQAGVEN